jgi:exopolyphosphatase/guanosine-5'-triphosphate,3'-diphosphate pyrophosphatase
VQTLAVVDLGSNSFRLEIGRVDAGQVYLVDTWREPIRFGAGVDERGNLTPPAMEAALACLARIGERLRGLAPTAVRAVATNVFRAAPNANAFIPQAERALGFPIEIVSGIEEARLIYLGVSHALPASTARRLVVDIGGGSTEFIIGRGFEPLRLESLPIGCVSFTLRHFADGELTAKAFRRAITAASAEIEDIATEFTSDRWDEAYASSGTAQALAEILELNGWAQGIDRRGLLLLRERMIAAGRVERLKLAGLRPQRAPVLAGGLAIMESIVEALGIDLIRPAGGALRLGVLYDLLGRRSSQDMREQTVNTFVERYRVDVAHARRVAALADALLAGTGGRSVPEVRQRLRWAAMLHEVGRAVSHAGFHKHSAYVLEHADMPGFSAQEQRLLGALALACRGGLRKVESSIGEPDQRRMIAALRLAVLFLHARRALDLPKLRLRVDDEVALSVPADWLDRHPLTAYLLDLEREDWRACGIAMTIDAR